MAELDGQREPLAVLERMEREAGDARAAALPKHVANEVRVMRRLNHANIVRFFDSFFSTSEGSLYLVSEYVAGGDLAAHIDERLKAVRDAAAREQFARRTVAAIVAALAYMHEQNVVHRDLKVCAQQQQPPPPSHRAWKNAFFFFWLVCQFL